MKAIYRHVERTMLAETRVGKEVNTQMGKTGIYLGFTRAKHLKKLSKKWGKSG